MKISRALIVLLFCVAPVFSSFAASSNQQAALEFVTRQHMGDNLMHMAMATGTKTQTFLMLVSKLGMDGAKASLTKELQASIPRFQPQWNENLARAYAKNFSQEELNSLAAEGRASKHANKVIERQTEIGKEMRAMSENVLTEFVKEALSNAFAKLPK